MIFRFLVKSIFFPPLAQIIAILLGLSLIKSHPRIGKLAITLGLSSLYFFATPIGTTLLMAELESVSPLTIAELPNTNAQAIVILSGWQNDFTPEFGQPVSGLYALSRIRYGAFLHTHTGLPILLTGGNVFGDNKRSLAATQAFDLETGFKIKPTWLEEKSKTTYENAKFSYEILEKENITHILLVSDAFHLKRATYLFERSGFVVTPAPTYFLGGQPLNFRSFIPSAHNLDLSSIAIHEWLGYSYYLIF